MFDEASDINMNANLNVFVNVLLTCGNVKTLTLSLVGSILVHAHIILITCSRCILLHHSLSVSILHNNNTYRIRSERCWQCIPLLT